MFRMFSIGNMVNVRRTCIAFIAFITAIAATATVPMLICGCQLQPPRLQSQFMSGFSLEELVRENLPEGASFEDGWELNVMPGAEWVKKGLRRRAHTASCLISPADAYGFVEALKRNMEKELYASGADVLMAWIVEDKPGAPVLFEIGYTIGSVRGYVLVRSVLVGDGRYDVTAVVCEG